VLSKQGGTQGERASECERVKEIKKEVDDE
jgi:hypothetical protein